MEQASIEQQLGDGRSFLFATTALSLADISVHFLLSWIRSFPGTKELFDAKRIPKAIEVRSNDTPPRFTNHLIFDHTVARAHQLPP